MGATNPTHTKLHPILSGSRREGADLEYTVLYKYYTSK